MTISLHRFSEEERRVLLQEPRIGPVVLERLEAAGFSSLDQLRQAGAQAAVQRVCLQTGQIAWRNRRRPLERVLQRH
jgi:hypothetical protein